MSQYRPGAVPNDPKEIPAFLDQELHRIERSWVEADEFRALKVLHAEPAKRFDGMEILADGTNWNPGSGAGRYYYLNSAWRFMG
jgi:hypothetical protein